MTKSDKNSATSRRKDEKRGTARVNNETSDSEELRIEGVAILENCKSDYDLRVPKQIEEPPAIKRPKTAAID